MRRSGRRITAVVMAAILANSTGTLTSFATRTPEKTAVPDIVELADAPEIPDTPEMPEGSALPELPEIPSIAEPAENPAMAEQPENPAMAEQPEIPAVSEQPETPETAESPEMMGGSALPELPALPKPPGEVFVSETDAEIILEEPDYAADLISLPIAGTFDTTAKEAILNRLNAIRKEACDEGVKYPSGGRVITLKPSDYRPLKWSRELEEATIQRAVEATFVRQHYRPDDSSCYTAYPASLDSKHGYHGENLAWNYEGIMKAIEQFYSEKKYLNADGTIKPMSDGMPAVIGHYTNIINPNYTHTALSGFDPGHDQWTSVAMEVMSAYATASVPEGKIDVSAISPVTVSIPAGSVTATIEGPAEINIGTTGRYTVQLKTTIDSFKSTTDVASPSIASSNAAVISISGSTATAKAQGSVTASWKSADGKLGASKKIAAIVPVSGVTVSGSANIGAGSTTQLKATVAPQNAHNKNVTWKSASSYIASVSSTGVVTGHRTGSTTITATTVGTGTDGRTRSATFRINVGEPVTSVSLDKETMKLVPGITGTLTATVLPYDAFDRSVTWKSSDTSIATVSKNGTVTAHRKGEVQITATTAGTTSAGIYLSASCTLRVIDFGFATVGGKLYWFENGKKQGVYGDPKNITDTIFGHERGREIYDPESNAWYWLDAVYDGAKAENKEVWMPYIYQSDLEQGLNPEGKWVRYDALGRMIKGWYYVDAEQALIYPEHYGNWYFYDHITGEMLKGWHFIADDVNTYCHFDETTGVLDGFR